MLFLSSKRTFLHAKFDGNSRALVVVTPKFDEISPVSVVIIATFDDSLHVSFVIIALYLTKVCLF